MGNVIYFYLEEFKQAVKFSHNHGIKQVFLDANGSQVGFIDSKLDAFVYDPINETVFQVPDCPDSAEGIVWDQNLMERFIFAVYNSSIISTFAFIRYHIEGTLIVYMYLHTLIVILN